MTARILDYSTLFRALRIARHDRPYHEPMTTAHAFALLKHLSRGSGPIAKRAWKALDDGGWIAVPVMERTRLQPLYADGLLASKPRRDPPHDEPPPRAA